MARRADRRRKGRPADAGTVELLARDLRDLGVREGGTLLVHSSLSALGRVPFGAETVIQGLLEALGPQGTLLMPALSYETVTEKAPHFDVRRTPSNVGVIPETFRQRPGTGRSIHPTHSVCGVGPGAGDLLEGHELDDTPCGRHSPFHRLPQVRGQILMLGCGLRPNTSMHAIEELVEPPYLFDGRVTYVLVNAAGHATEKAYTAHNFSGWDQRYDRVAQVLVPPDLRVGPILASTSHLIEAQGLWSAAHAKLDEDPIFFVDHIKGADS